MDQFINRCLQIETEFYRRINRKLNEVIDLSNVIKLIGYLSKKSHFISVDFTEIYKGQINIIRYFINWFHFILINCGFLTLLTFVINDDLYSLIDNEFLPKNARSVLVVGLIFIFLTISLRFDVLINEWYHRLKPLKFVYYLQFDVKMQHGLTRRNLFKLSIITKLFDFGFKIGAPLALAVISSVTLYVAIRSGRSAVFILCPVLVYLTTNVVTTISICAVLLVISLYYYMLRFDQLNQQFESIEKRSSSSVSVINQIKLIRLVKRHSQEAQELNMFNLMMRRTVGVYWVSIALLQMLPLNIFLEEDQVLFFKFFYFVYVIGALAFGLVVSVLFSWQISKAHQPIKSIHKILTRNLHRKQSTFYFKWKVIKRKLLLWKMNNFYIFLDV